MANGSYKMRLWVITIGLWTVIQTGLHIFYLSYAYMMAVCRIRPTYYDTVLLYLTYFYKKSCGSIELSNEALFISSKEIQDDQVEVFNELYSFLNVTLQYAELPERSHGSDRTEFYITVMLIADLLWICSSFALLVGLRYLFKRNYLLLGCFGPWLVCCAFISLLDVISSVQYGLDIIYVNSYTSWLRFIGVTNANNAIFHAFDSLASSSKVMLIPAGVTVSLLSRFFLIWLINVVCFFVILFLLFSDLSMGVERTTPQRPNPRDNYISVEMRIRNWQEFYGSVDAASTMTSSNAATFNSSGKSADFPPPKKLNNVNQLPVIDLPTIDGEFHRYSDVASNVSSLAALTKLREELKTTVVKNHLPWSYINNKNGLKLTMVDEGTTRV